MTRSLLLFAFLFLLFAPRAEAQSFGPQSLAQLLTFPTSEDVVRTAAVEDGHILHYRLADLHSTDYHLSLGDVRGNLMHLRDAVLQGPAEVREIRTAYASRFQSLQIGLALASDFPAFGLHRGDEVVALDYWGLAAFDLEIEYPEYVATIDPGFSAELVVYTHGQGLRRVRIYGSGAARV